MLSRIRKAIREVFAFYLCLAFFSGCTTPLKNFSSHIPREALKNRGVIVGRISLFDHKNQQELGGMFGRSFFAYMHRAGEKKPYNLDVTNKDNGYFAWVVPPGEYRIHYCLLQDPYDYIEVRDFSPSVKVRVGDMVYIGHLHYDIGKTHLKETLKRSFQKIGKQSLKEVLTDPAGLLIDVDLTVMDKSEEIKTHFPILARDPTLIFSSQLTQGWSSRIEDGA